MPLFRREPKPDEPTPQPAENQSLDEAVKSALTGEHHVEAEAERRIQEAQRLQGAAPEDGQPSAAATPRHEGALFDELRVAEEGLAARREQEDLLARELEATEARLAEGQKKTEEALERAAVRLKEVEQRAAEAEARANRAERLAVLKAEELEREARLREILDRIAEAESRAAAAESRARSAVSGVGPGTDPAPPAPAPPPGPQTDPKPPAPAPAPEPPGPAPDPEPPAYARAGSGPRAARAELRGQAQPELGQLRRAPLTGPLGHPDRPGPRPARAQGPLQLRRRARRDPGVPGRLPRWPEIASRGLSAGGAQIP